MTCMVMYMNGARTGMIKNFTESRRQKKTRCVKIQAAAGVLCVAVLGTGIPGICAALIASGRRRSTGAATTGFG